MQTRIHTALIDEPEVAEADRILRSCVHCGFCTAVCPTYRLLGDELDGPRGRIYLIKDMLEQNRIADAAVTHIDRCLTCRACETACPSGVEYGRLLDIGRGMIETRKGEGILARLLRAIVPRPRLMSAIMRLGRFARPVLPPRIKSYLPALSKRSYDVEVANWTRRVLVLEGCVQRAATPEVNRALEYLLAQHSIGVTYIEDEGCCGALDYHLGAHETGRERMRRLIDHVLAMEDVDTVVSTASGCGVTIKEYPAAFASDDEYRQRAQQVADMTVDASELLSGLSFECAPDHAPVKVAFHSPCTLQHGQKLGGAVEDILHRAGFELIDVADGHLCCGSAGTYAILQPKLAGELKSRKLDVLESGKPDVIATANIGCQLHLAPSSSSQGHTPVVHWLNLMADHARLGKQPPQ